MKTQYDITTALKDKSDIAYQGTQYVHNQMSIFPYASHAIGKSNQSSSISIFERCCIDRPGLMSDLFFRDYSLQNILNLRLTSKTLCEFINLYNFLGKETYISFWYKQLCRVIDKINSRKSAENSLDIDDMYVAKRFLKLLLSNQYDKKLIDGIQSIDFGKLNIHNDNCQFLDTLLTTLCQNLPASLEKISIGCVHINTSKTNGMTFKLPKGLNKVKTLFIKDISDATLDLQDVTSLVTLDVKSIGYKGILILPTIMSNLETFYIRSMPIADSAISTILTLPEQLNNLSYLHIGEITRNSQIRLPKTLNLNKLSHLHIEELGGDRILTLPISLPNLTKLSIGRTGILDLPDAFPNLEILSLGWIRTCDDKDRTRNNLKLPDSFPNLTDFSIAYIDHHTTFRLPSSVPKLKKLSIGEVHYSASFEVTKKLNNLETLVIKNIPINTNFKLSPMPNLKTFTIENIREYGYLEFPGTFDALKALDTNINNEKFHLSDSGNNSVIIRSKKK